MADTDNRILADFADAVRCGLAREQKEIPARYLYDRRGSDLFEEITRLPEYYPTRTEIELIRKHSGTIADRVGHGRTVVEFGSGSSAKTPSFLSTVRAAAYVPVDISADMLADAAKSVAAAMPDLDVHPLAGDFTRPLDLPAAVRTSPKLGFFPGSTIGNMTAAEAVDLLRAFGGTLGGDAHLVIGVDLVKDAAILGPAYDDAKGITAEFILGILRRLEDDLGAALQQRDWRYRSFWNSDMRRIEMHVEATRDTAIALDGARWTVAKGETIHVSNSHKYSLSDAAILARAAGFRQVEAWTDDDGLFSLQLWRGLPEDLCW